VQARTLSVLLFYVAYALERLASSFNGKAAEGEREGQEEGEKERGSDIAHWRILVDQVWVVMS
jgi:hypothetical protein